MVINWAIVGYADIVTRQIMRAMEESKESRLVALLRRDKLQAKKTAKQYGIEKYYDNVEDLGKDKDVQAVYIATPPFLHHSQTVKLANYGKHILCEKPMALSIEECKNMIDAASKNRVKLMIGHCFRFHPSVEKIRELIGKKAIGQIAYTRTSFTFLFPVDPHSWYYKPEMSGGGPMMDVGIHCIDTLRYIFGKKIKSIYATSKPGKNKTQVELTMLASLNFENDLKALVECSFETIRTGGVLEIYGSGGIIRGERIYENKKGTVSIQREEGKESIDVRDDNIYRVEIDHFIECIKEDREPLISGKEGLEDIRIILGAYRSCETGRRVNLNQE